MQLTSIERGTRTDFARTCLDRRKRMTRVKGRRQLERQQAWGVNESTPRLGERRDKVHPAIHRIKRKGLLVPTLDLPADAVAESEKVAVEVSTNVLTEVAAPVEKKVVTERMKKVYQAAQERVCAKTRLVKWVEKCFENGGLGCESDGTAGIGSRMYHDMAHSRLDFATQIRSHYYIRGHRVVRMWTFLPKTLTALRRFFKSKWEAHLREKEKRKKDWAGRVRRPPPLQPRWHEWAKEWADIEWEMRQAVSSEGSSRGHGEQLSDDDWGYA